MAKFRKQKTFERSVRRFGGLGFPWKFLAFTGLGLFAVFIVLVEELTGWDFVI